MASLLKRSERTSYDRRFAVVRQMPTPIPPGERYRIGIDMVGVGGYIRFEGNTFAVQRINTYERQGARWPELELYCLDDGSSRYLEWEREDEISVYVSRAKLDLGTVGIRNEEHLWKMAHDQDGSLRHAGETFRYHEDSQVGFRRDGKGEPTPFRQYLFASANKRRFLCVEEWGSREDGHEHNVILSEYLDPSSIEVLAKGGGDV